MKKFIKVVAAIMLIGITVYATGCKKEKKAEVETSQVTNVTSSSATAGGIVTFDGNSTVIERGVCWGRNTNPDVGSNHLNSGTGMGSFTCNITDLEPATTYYVRAYAINSTGISYGAQVTFTTLTSGGGNAGGGNGGGGNGGGNDGGDGGGDGGDASENLPTVLTTAVSEVTANTAVCVGNVTDNGGYAVTSRGVCWSTHENPTTTDSHLSSGSGTGSFTIEITGLSVNTTYYVRAFASNEAGTAYGNQLSFTTSDNHTGAPTGAINGYFTVDGSKQIYFSKGNLQYIGSAASPYWKFADNQWDYLGTTTGQNSGYQTVDRDLFGWGTSGYNYCTCYQPWSTVNNAGAYGPYTNLQEKSDWGYNPISNGGNEEGQWRTPTKEDWDYLFNFRPTQSGLRYAKAQITGLDGNNSINGVILLPNDWQTSYYSLNETNTEYSDYDSNPISITNWVSIFEAKGAVFLPAAGSRSENSVNTAGIYGDYWSSTNNSQYTAVSLYFSTGSLDTMYAIYQNKCYGYAVRLIQDAK